MAYDIGVITMSDLDIWLLEREEWGAKAPLEKLRAIGPARAITVHHTSPMPDQGSLAGDTRWIQELHQNKGWADIGYHYVVARASHVHSGAPPYAAVGRGLSDGLTLGSHVRNHNRGNIGIVIVGNYDTADPMTPADVFSTAQQAILELLIALLCRRYRLIPGPETIRGHRDWPGHLMNDCPGNLIVARLPLIQQRVGSLIDRVDTG